MKLAIAILLLASSSAWAQQSGTTQDLSIHQTWRASESTMSADLALNASWPKRAPNMKILLIFGGVVGTKELVSVTCDGQIMVRGKPSDDNGAIGEALREVGKKHCARGY